MQRIPVFITKVLEFFFLMNLEKRALNVDHNATRNLFCNRKFQRLTKPYKIAYPGSSKKKNEKESVDTNEENRISISASRIF